MITKQLKYSFGVAFLLGSQLLFAQTQTTKSPTLNIHNTSLDQYALPPEKTGTALVANSLPGCLDVPVSHALPQNTPDPNSSTEKNSSTTGELKDDKTEKNTKDKPKK